MVEGLDLFFFVLIVVLGFNIFFFFVFIVLGDGCCCCCCFLVFSPYLASDSFTLLMDVCSPSVKSGTKDVVGVDGGGAKPS